MYKTLRESRERAYRELTKKPGIPGPISQDLLSRIVVDNGKDVRNRATKRKEGQDT
jgi:hypothetical protein